MMSNQNLIKNVILKKRILLVVYVQRVLSLKIIIFLLFITFVKNAQKGIIQILKIK